MKMRLKGFKTSSIGVIPFNYNMMAWSDPDGATPAWLSNLHLLKG
jgi:hypothetical protein